MSKAATSTKGPNSVTGNPVDSATGLVTYLEGKMKEYDGILSNPVGKSADELRQVSLKSNSVKNDLANAKRILARIEKGGY